MKLTPVWYSYHFSPSSRHILKIAHSACVLYLPLPSHFKLQSLNSRLWRVGLFDFGSGSGRVWPKSSGFGFGFGYCAYCGLKANSLVILCNFISCKGTELMLRKNWNIITTYSSLHQQPCLPSKRTVWFRRKRHPKFRDTLETILMVPLQSVFCASTTQPKVTPTNNHLLINIHNLMFSLVHQGLPISPKALRNLL